MWSQVPFVTESTDPTGVEPLTTGATVFTGAGSVTATPLEFAEPLPAAFVAVTTQRIVAASSASTSVYVFAVWPTMFAPLRCHWYAKVGAPKYVQVPSVVESTEPTCAVPVTAGAVTICGFIRTSVVLVTNALIVLVPSATIVVGPNVEESASTWPDAPESVSVPVTVCVALAPSATAREVVHSRSRFVNVLLPKIVSAAPPVPRMRSV